MTTQPSNGKNPFAVTNRELEHRLGYHPANDQTAPAHDDVRKAIIAAAKKLNRVVPDGRPKSLALTKLEEAMFWANNAVATGEAASPVAKDGSTVDPQARAANERAGAKVPAKPAEQESDKVV